MKTLLIYDKAVPVTLADHGKISLEPPASYEFTREMDSVAVVAGEFAAVAPHFPIVFATGQDGILPVAVLSAKPFHNSFLLKDGGWNAPYIPAFIRRYPFVFGTDTAAQNFTLLIDENYPGLNKKGKGERLFDEKGERTDFLNRSLDFLREYQAQVQRNNVFCSKLLQLGLLDPVEARMPLPGNPEHKLTGFQVVNRDRLKALSGEALAQLSRADELELIFQHLFSLRNLSRVIELDAAQAA